MSSTRVEVLLWAKRTVAKKSAEAHQLLEIQADATVDQAQEAFHKIARIAHPDLHRTTLTPDEIELVTTAYAQVANAYQQFRTSRMQTTKLAKPTANAPSQNIKLPGGGVIRGTSTTRPPGSITQAPLTARTQTPIAITPPAAAAAVPAPVPAPAVLVPEPAMPTAAHATGEMNGKALIYYRKAELALRQGDLRAATLNLKMAIGADPQSKFLRSALSEVQAETDKK